MPKEIHINSVKEKKNKKKVWYGGDEITEALKTQLRNGQHGENGSVEPCLRTELGYNR